MKKVITSIILFFISTSPALVRAVTGGVQPPDGLTDPLNGQSFSDLIDRVITWMLRISAPILVVVIIWGGFQILTAGDDENKYKSGKKTITYAVIGFTIILLAKGLILVIKEFLGVTGTSN